MAGGRGERFWPLSRLECPKHLLPVVGDKAMLVQTLERLGSEYPAERIIIITNTEQKAAIQRICPQLPAHNIIGEPMGRDTAAAVALAAVIVRRRDPGAVFTVLPADHVIHDTVAFQRMLNAAFKAAEEKSALVTIGIRPAYAATGYGYIQRGAACGECEGMTVYAVEGFREKPDADTAEQYLKNGAYFWNAGMFFWSVASICAALEKLTPELWQTMEQLSSEWHAEEDLESLLERYYPGLEKISVDYAVMEKAAKVRTLESSFDWDDVGEWPAVARHYPEDKQGNVVRGQAWLQNAGGNIVRTEAGHTVALIGVDDLIVVQTEDATLICPRSRAQEIKQAVKGMGEDARFKHLM